MDDAKNDDDDDAVPLDGELGVSDDVGTGLLIVFDDVPQLKNVLRIGALSSFV